VYIVKPKMHGPEEVTPSPAICSTADRGRTRTARDTLKVGIMDEERRTTLNLKECIRAARSRVIFINTGFLDRTGDEIHTSMEAGPVVRKEAMKHESWIRCYETTTSTRPRERLSRARADRQGHVGEAGPEMAQMLDSKIAHPLAGANCAWVPSPTAATLHALHYHQVDVAARQHELLPDVRARGATTSCVSRCCGRRALDATLRSSTSSTTTRRAFSATWCAGSIRAWAARKCRISTNVGLMEDRATLRISSQHIANWLRHGICDTGAGAHHAGAHGGRGRPAEFRRSALSQYGAGL
jgi:malate synthase